jgi:hypothetical protein
MKAAAQAHHNVPAVPNELALTEIRDRLKVLQQNGLWPVVVFDGLKNPLKSHTHDKMKLIVEKIQKKLENVV